MPGAQQQPQPGEHPEHDDPGKERRNERRHGQNEVDARHPVVVADLTRRKPPRPLRGLPGCRASLTGHDALEELRLPGGPRLSIWHGNQLPRGPPGKRVRAGQGRARQPHHRQARCGRPHRGRRPGSGTGLDPLDVPPPDPAALSYRACRELPLVSTALSDLLPRVFPVDVTDGGAVSSRVRSQFWNQEGDGHAGVRGRRDRGPGAAAGAAVGGPGPPGDGDDDERGQAGLAGTAGRGWRS